MNNGRPGLGEALEDSILGVFLRKQERANGINFSKGLDFVPGENFKSGKILQKMDDSYGQFYYDGKQISAYEAFSNHKYQAAFLTEQLLLEIAVDISEVLEKIFCGVKGGVQKVFGISDDLEIAKMQRMGIEDILTKSDQGAPSGPRMRNIKED